MQTETKREIIRKPKINIVDENVGCKPINSARASIIGQIMGYTKNREATGNARNLAREAMESLVTDELSNEKLLGILHRIEDANLVAPGKKLQSTSSGQYVCVICGEKIPRNEEVRCSGFYDKIARTYINLHAHNICREFSRHKMEEKKMTQNEQNKQEKEQKITGKTGKKLKRSLTQEEDSAKSAFAKGDLNAKSEKFFEKVKKEIKKAPKDKPLYPTEAFINQYGFLQMGADIMSDIGYTRNEVSESGKSVYPKVAVIIKSYNQTTGIMEIKITPPVTSAIEMGEGFKVDEINETATIDETTENSTPA